MYCINCGVELADHEKRCPLCKTLVCNPDFVRPNAPTPYPRRPEGREEMNRSGVLFILSFIFLTLMFLSVASDLSINNGLIWSGYAIGALLLGYLIIVLPLWFKAPNPLIFVSADFVGVMAYLYAINYFVGGDWFFTFALPVTAMLGGIICGVIAALRYVHRGALFIFGGAFILLGMALTAAELLMNLTFHYTRGLIWSAYPLIVFILLGIMLIIIATCTPLRESLKRKFFM